MSEKLDKEDEDL